MAQVAHVLYCVEVDPATQECTQEAWMPAPSLLPPLSVGAALELLGAAVALLAVAWGVKWITRAIRN